MRGLADKAYAAGFNVILLNQRNCGGTERLAAGLYHSGLTADADYVIRELATTDGVQQVVVAGYSLGGNLALKLAGDYADAPPPQLRAVCAISPVMELEACVRALERRQNVFYQWNFVRGLKNRMRRKALCFPGRFALERLDAIRRCASSTRSTLRHTSASRTRPTTTTARARCASSIACACPARIITAEDDPFVPTAPLPRCDRPFEPEPRRHHHDARRSLRVHCRRARRQRRLLGGIRDPRVRHGAYELHGSQDHAECTTPTRSG